MIPFPKALKGKLIFGDKKQLAALKAYHKIQEEEFYTLPRKTGILLKFYLKEKERFKTLARNNELANRISLLMHQIDDPEWEYDEIKKTKIQKGGNKWYVKAS